MSAGKTDFESMFSDPLRFGDLGHALRRDTNPTAEDARRVFVAYGFTEDELAPLTFEKGFVRFGFPPEEVRADALNSGEAIWWGPVGQKRGAKPVWFAYQRPVLPAAPAGK